MKPERSRVWIWVCLSTMLVILTQQAIAESPGKSIFAEGPSSSFNDPPSKPVITFPAHQSTIQIEGDPSQPFVVTWNPSTDPDGDALSYTWRVELLVVLYEQEVGDATQVDLTIGTIHDLLVQNNFGPGSSLTLTHRILVSDGIHTVSSDFAQVTLVVGNLNYPPDPVTELFPSSGDIVLAGDPASMAMTAEWNVPVDVDGDPLTYVWEVSENSSMQPVRLMRTGVTDTTLTVSTGELNDVLRDQLLVPGGGSIDLYHRVTVSDGVTAPVLGSVKQFRVTRGAVTARELDNVPGSALLLSNYPNPFSTRTTVSFAIPSNRFTSIRLYNLSGQEVGSWINRVLDAGWHSIEIDAQKLPAGVYLYQLEVGDQQITRKMTVIPG